MSRKNGFTNGNITDQFKKGINETYFEWIFRDHKPRNGKGKHIDLYAGAGIYPNEGRWRGSPMWALDAAKKIKEKMDFYFFEFSKKMREKLDKSVHMHRILPPNMKINIEGEWRGNNIKELIDKSDEFTSWYIDPTYIIDYLEYGWDGGNGESGILDHLPDILDTNAKVSMYVPEATKDRNNRLSLVDRSLVRDIEDCIIASGRHGIDLSHIENKNNPLYERIDHNIIIGHYLNEIREIHDDLEIKLNRNLNQDNYRLFNI